ncbi:hypothetical protein MHY1_p00171 (plasmid) [Methylovirgula sp. HY1]|nr:hypothetical protein MHY1_p00171 [Methylovirgula sp. HY1]
MRLRIADAPSPYLLIVRYRASDPVNIRRLRPSKIQTEGRAGRRADALIPDPPPDVELSAYNSEAAFLNRKLVAAVCFAVPRCPLSFR